MDLSSKLTSLEKQAESTPKVSIKELTKKIGYKILEAKKVNTKFDRQAVMLTVEMDTTSTAVVFLPARFERILDEDDLKEISSSKKYKVRCTGLNGLTVDVKIWK
uniref:Uncharacterized protein n=1 Tax=Graphocephala atropunctata TaxID=36148 RepID=A0A1B6M2L6_9HEMI